NNNTRYNRGAFMADMKPVPDRRIINEPPKQQQQMGRATVARGHTVTIPTGERTLVGYSLDNNAVYSQISRDYRSGHEVELPLDEIKTLRAAGALIDPGAPMPSYGIGPSFDEATRPGVENEPSIRGG